MSKAKRFLGLGLVLGLLVAAGSFVGAQDPGPTIQGKTEYDAHGLVRLAVDKVPSGAAIRWKVTPKKGVERSTTAKERCEFAAPPGEYEVECLLISQGEKGLELVELSVQVTIKAPPAPPPAKSKSPSMRSADSALGWLVFGKFGCTACPIEPRNADGSYDLLTAAHCVPGVGSVGSFTAQDGRLFPVKVTQHNPIADLAWIRTTTAPNEPLATAVLAERAPDVGTVIMQAGYNKSTPRVASTGEVIAPPNFQGRLTMSLRVDEGDSGGPVWAVGTGEIVSAVCCTSAMAVKAPMRGGSCVEAWRMRRGQTSTAGDTGYSPVPMPICVF